MKVWTNGRYISARFVTSTLCGQMVNTSVFYIFGLWRMIPARALTRSIVVASLTKVSGAVTFKVSSWRTWAGLARSLTALLAASVGSPRIHNVGRLHKRQLKATTPYFKPERAEPPESSKPSEGGCRGLSLVFDVGRPCRGQKVIGLL